MAPCGKINALGHVIVVKLALDRARHRCQIGTGHRDRLEVQRLRPRIWRRRTGFPILHHMMDLHQCDHAIGSNLPPEIFRHMYKQLYKLSHPIHIYIFFIYVFIYIYMYTYIHIYVYIISMCFFKPIHIMHIAFMKPHLHSKNIDCGPGCPS